MQNNFTYRVLRKQNSFTEFNNDSSYKFHLTFVFNMLHASELNI